MTYRSPEEIAAVWARLTELAGLIVDEETRAQYLGVWRGRFDRELSAVASAAVTLGPLHALRRAEDGDYWFPDSESESARQLIAIVRALLRKREERRAIGDEIKDLMAMAKVAGFVGKEITAVVRDIECDLAHGPGSREDAEMVRVLYRRTLGVRGPMSEAMLPQVVDGRPKQIGAGAKRRATVHALIDARGIEV